MLINVDLICVGLKDYGLFMYVVLRLKDVFTCLDGQVSPTFPGKNQKSLESEISLKR